MARRFSQTWPITFIIHWKGCRKQSGKEKRERGGGGINSNSIWAVGVNKTWIKTWKLNSTLFCVEKALAKSRTGEGSHTNCTQALSADVCQSVLLRGSVGQHWFWCIMDERAILGLWGVLRCDFWVERDDTWLLPKFQWRGWWCTLTGTPSRYRVRWWLLKSDRVWAEALQDGTGRLREGQL